MTDTTERLDKRLARQLDCARGQARQWIENGWVRVDGQVIEQPQAQISAGQQVVVDEHADQQKVEMATMVLHQPAGMAVDALAEAVRADSQRSDDPSGVRRLQRHFQHLRVALPLPPYASGLVIVSQDGRVLSHLASHGLEVEHEYLVEVSGQASTWTVGKIQAALRGAQAVKISWQSEQRLRVVGKRLDPAVLRHACQENGLAVQAMRRLRIGRVGLNKLPAGQWHYLPAGTRF